MTAFRALWGTESDGKASVSLREDVQAAELPAGEVVARVKYSTVNYKDGLAIQGNKNKIMRKLPMAPGIDWAGVVESSQSPDFKPGDEVVLTGWGVGEAHSGGLAQRATAKAAWLVRKPDGLTLKQTMAVGTAGFTAMLCVMALEEMGVKPGSGEAVVTGAAGGVGSVAVALLAKLGYTVAASTGRESEAEYLKALGASSIVPRAELAQPAKLLAKERWAGAVDTVGSHVLANLLTMTKYGGTVAACGLAGGMDLPASVAPFILRGIKLYGIDSVMCPQPRRGQAWARLAKDMPLDKLDAMTAVRPLKDAPQIAADILKGQVRGRTVIDLDA